MLGAVAACDLALVKLYEGHTDALAILAELDGIDPRQRQRLGRLGRRTANGTPRRESADGANGDRITLHGTKAWCSGAAFVTHALVTAWNERDEPILAAVDLRQPGVRVTNEGWVAVGMNASASVDVHFDNARAVRSARRAPICERPGFWQGGGGIAACWFGAASAIGDFVRRDAARRADPHKLAHLGAIDTALSERREPAARKRRRASTANRTPTPCRRRCARGSW